MLLAATTGASGATGAWAALAVFATPEGGGSSSSSSSCDRVKVTTADGNPTNNKHHVPQRRRQQQRRRGGRETSVVWRTAAAPNGKGGGGGGEQNYMGWGVGDGNGGGGDRRRSERRELLRRNLEPETELLPMDDLLGPEGAWDASRMPEADPVGGGGGRHRGGMWSGGVNASSVSLSKFGAKGADTARRMNQKRRIQWRYVCAKMANCRGRSILVGGGCLSRSGNCITRCRGERRGDRERRGGEG